jgi:hypothetical protein
LSVISEDKHPSARHSILDWSDERQMAAAGGGHVDAVDTIVQTGEVLYIPAYWFHFVISMEYSFQCNSRSGAPEMKQGVADIAACGFSKLKVRL